MSLPTDPASLHDELESAKAAFAQPLSVRKTILESYTADPYGDQFKNAPENHVHEYLSLMVPRLVATNPRVRVKSRVGGPAQVSSVALEHGLNRWVKDTNHVRFLERMAVQYLTGWGIGLVTLQETEGFTDNEDVSTKPVVVSLDPEQVLWDPASLTWEQARWRAHRYAIDLEDALERKDWDKEAVQSCAVDAGLDGLRATENVPKRKQIAVWEVWIPDGEVPETEDSEERVGPYNGVIVTLGAGGAGVTPLCEPYGFYGPRTGPYVLFGAYTPPRRSIPMSPLMATWKTVEELNLHALAISRAAARRKKIAIADALRPSDADKIQNAMDGSTVLIAGFDPSKFLEIELGGLTKEQMEGYAVIRERLERLSALDEASRGRADPNSTATAVAVASETSAARIGWIADRFRASDEELLRSVAWYMFHERSVQFPIGDETTGGVTVMYQGGADEWDRFDFYEFEIERYSMERTSELVQMRRGESLLRLLGEIGPMLPQVAPFMDIRKALNYIGDYLNTPELGEIVSPDNAAQVFNAQQAEAADARFAGDVSPAARGGEMREMQHNRPRGKGTSFGGRKDANAVRSEGL